MLSCSVYAEYDISQANKAYQNQDYEKAKEGYEKLVENGVKNFNLFYNLGNTYFKIGNKGLARLFYEKAAKYHPLNKNLQYNISLLKSTLKDKEQIEESFIEEAVKKVYYLLSINLLSAFILISFVILMGCVAVIIISKKYFLKKVIPVVMISFSFLFILFLVITILRLNEFHSQKSAVILTNTVRAYSGPSQDFQQVFTIHQGLKVKIEKYDEDWVLIKLLTGNGGWVKKNNIGLI